MARDWRDDRIAEQEKTIAKLERKLEERDEVTAKLTAQVEALLARVANLEEQVRRSSRNSSQPPSSDGPAKPPPQKNAPSGKKPGAQEGQKKTSGRSSHRTKLINESSFARNVAMVPRFTRRRGRIPAPPSGVRVAEDLAAGDGVRSAFAPLRVRHAYHCDLARGRANRRVRRACHRDGGDADGRLSRARTSTSIGTTSTATEQSTASSSFPRATQRNCGRRTSERRPKRVLFASAPENTFSQCEWIRRPYRASPKRPGICRAARGFSTSPRCFLRS